MSWEPTRKADPRTQFVRDLLRAVVTAAVPISAEVVVSAGRAHIVTGGPVAAAVRDIRTAVVLAAPAVAACERRAAQSTHHEPCRDCQRGAGLANPPPLRTSLHPCSPVVRVSAVFRRAKLRHDLRTVYGEK